MVDKRKSTGDTPSPTKRFKANSSLSVKASSSSGEARSPGKRKTQEEKDAEQQAKNERKAKKEKDDIWKASLVPWKLDYTFKHESGIVS